MARHEKGKRGRRKGSKVQVIDLEECPFVYQKPFFQARKWRVRKKARIDGKLTTVTLQQAENLSQAVTDAMELARKEQEVAREAALPPEERSIKEITLEAAWDKWILDLKQLNGIRASTQREYEGDGRSYKKHFGSTMLVHLITLENVEELFRALADRQGRTKMKHAAMLRRFLDYCQKHGHCRENVAKLLTVPKDWRTQARDAAVETGQALTPDEAKTLLQHCLKPFSVDSTPEKFRKARAEATLNDLHPPRHLWRAVAIALLSGLRRGNIVGRNGLRWEDLDLAEGKETLTIDGARMKAKKKFHVPLNAELAVELRRLRRGLGRVPLRNERVIADVGEFKRSWESALRRSSLEERGVRFHDLRHTFCAWLAEAAPYAVLQRLMGHAPTRTVTDRYAKHVDFEALRKHVNLLPSLLGKPPKRKSKQRAAS